MDEIIKSTETIEPPQLKIDAEKQLLDYTVSTEWKEIEKLNWTTAEVVEQMEIFGRSKYEISKSEVDIRYYQTVFETQNDAEILKSELGDLIEELKQESTGRSESAVRVESAVKKQIEMIEKLINVLNACHGALETYGKHPFIDRSVKQILAEAKQGKHNH